MNSFKSLTLAFCVASFACSAALAETREVSGTLSAQDRMNSDQPRGGGFTTHAKVALLYGNGKIIRSVNVTGVSNPFVGVYCITPSVKLNIAKIYPDVTVEYGLTVGSPAFAFWLDTSLSHINCPSTTLEVVTLAGNGQSSNQVGFDITVQ